MVKRVLKLLSTWGTRPDYINPGEKPVPNSTAMSALISQYNKLQTVWANLYNKISLSSLFEKKSCTILFLNIFFSKVIFLDVVGSKSKPRDGKRYRRRSSATRCAVLYGG